MAELFRIKRVYGVCVLKFVHMFTLCLQYIGRERKDKFQEIKKKRKTDGLYVSFVIIKWVHIYILILFSHGDYEIVFFLLTLNF